MLTRKTTLILLVLLAALAVWIPQQRKLAQARLVLAEAQAQRVKLDERIATATLAMESEGRELRAQQSNRAASLASAAKLEQELARVDPESRWVGPPAALPDWNAESPYAWLRKEMLATLRLSAFTDNGELSSEAAAVLTATESQRRALNTTIPRLLAEYRALEVAKAERVAESLPGVEGEDSKVTVRIKPMPEDGARLKQQFEAALRGELGEQRAGLLMQLSEGWLKNQFKRFGTETRTISVSRHANGTYSISNGGSFVGPTPTIYNDYIPAHLLPLFSDVLNPADVAHPTEPTRN